MSAIADDGEIRSTLAEHAAKISSIGREVGTLSTKMDKVLDALSDVRGKSGPGIMQILGVCALVSGLIASVAGGIMVLVSANIRPDIVTLSTSTLVLQRAEDDRMRSDRTELQTLREQLAKRTEARLRELERAQGWAPNVKSGS